MAESQPTKIAPMVDGPLMIEGDFTLTDSDGNPIPSEKTRIFLCRCGASSKKPFCDGAHKKIGFTSALPVEDTSGAP